MTSRLPRVTAKELIKAIRKNGFLLDSSEGGHQHFVHPEKSGKVTIPVHAGRIIGPGLLKRILKQAELDPDDLKF